MKTILRTILACCAWLLATGGAWACAICAPAEVNTTVLARMLAADRIVLAQPLGDHLLFQPRSAIVGAPSSEPVRITDWVSGTAYLPPAGAPQQLVLLYDISAKRWSAAGYVLPARVEWLKKALSMPRGEDTAAAPSLARAQFFMRALEDASPVIAQIAYEEASAFPYAALRGLSVEVDPYRPTAWLKDARLRARYPLYYLLYGFAAPAKAAAALGKAVREEDVDRSPAELAAMLTAMIEMNRDAGLEWLENYFLSRPTVPDADVQAALLALSVHATPGGRVSLDELLAAYSRFIRYNPQRAGFVATDLANRERWEFAPAFADALRTGKAQVYGSRYAILFYFLRNPLPQAKKLVEELRAGGFL